jgi:hypothetical protein
MIFSTYGRSPAALTRELEQKLDWVARSRDFLADLRRRSSSWWPLGDQDDDPDATAPAAEDAAGAFFDRVEKLLEGVRQYGAGFLGKDLDFLGAQGISFVLPVEQVDWVVLGILEHGQIRRGYLGLTAQTDPETPGALVLRVREDGPAAQAGVREGDVIVACGAVVIRSCDQLHAALSMARAGESRELRVRRGEEEVEVTVDLAPRTEGAR